MPLPSMLTYNELDGSEVAHVLTNRFGQFVAAVPYFKPHLTLPRVKITIQVKLEVWADQPQPEIIPLSDRFDVVVEGERAPTETIRGEAVDSTAPVPGGHPPDQIREMHGLPISQPARGPREVGGQISISDQRVTLEGREVESDLPGLRISRTGSGVIDGMATSSNAVVAKIDQGPAGLRVHQMNREPYHFGGKK
jgi:hypothetical protein